MNFFHLPPPRAGPVQACPSSNCKRVWSVIGYTSPDKTAGIHSNGCLRIPACLSFRSALPPTCELIFPLADNPERLDGSQLIDITFFSFTLPHWHKTCCVCHRRIGGPPLPVDASVSAGTAQGPYQRIDQKGIDQTGSWSHLWNARGNQSACGAMNISVLGRRSPGPIEPVESVGSRPYSSPASRLNSTTDVRLSVNPARRMAPGNNRRRFNVTAGRNTCPAAPAIRQVCARQVPVHEWGCRTPRQILGSGCAPRCP